MHTNMPKIIGKNPEIQNSEFFSGYASEPWYRLLLFTVTYWHCLQFIL